MANETLGVLASFVTAGGKALSKRSEYAVITEITTYTDVQINRNYLGATNLDSGWYVKRNISLLDAFATIMGRQPNQGENVRFTIGADVAIIGGAENFSAALIGGYWGNGGTVEVHNYGWISGFGANSQIVSGLIPLAGAAVDSVSQLTVYNNGLITGGGGTGGIYDGGWGSCYSGAGAPFGVGYPPRSTSATLLQPSAGQRTTAWSQPFQSGYGGAPGEPGQSVPAINWWDLNHPGAAGGLPGFVSTGNVTVINRGAGVTKGQGA